MPWARGLPSSSARKRIVLFVFVFFATVLLGLGTGSVAFAMPVQFFYVPFPEDDILTSFNAIDSAPSSPITTYVVITSVADDTIVYYDQWEDGYDIDISNTLNIYSATNLSGTQIWGDENPDNGAPPGIPSDAIDAGTTIVLSNEVVTSTLQEVIDFDGGDKLAATKTIALTRSSWASGSATLLAGCVEVFDTNNWGTEYRAPVGQNLPDGVDFQMFEYTALSIMAGTDLTTVQVDATGDGTFETVLALDEGESAYVAGVSAGGHVIADHPIQVDIFMGDAGSTYESRDSALVPINLWDDSYYTPVSTPSYVDSSHTDADTTAWLYNPGAGDIEVTYARRDTSGALDTSTITVPAGGVAKQVLENADDGTGSHFYSSGASAGAVFYGLSTTDSNESSYGYPRNMAWDWGFTMIPETMLTTQALVGLGLGRDPTSGVNPSENGNPVWVTTVGNGETPATVYVDYDADPSTGVMQDAGGYWCDASYSLKELEQAKVYVGSGVTVDATSSARTTDRTTASNLTVTHTTGTGDNRLMLVGIAIGNDATQETVDSVTYGGVALNWVCDVTAPGGGGGGARPRVEIWAMPAPPSGAASVEVELSGARTFSFGVTTFSGVDVSNGITSALGSSATNASSSGNVASVPVTTAEGQVVYDAVGKGNIGYTDPGVFSPAGLWTQLCRGPGWRNPYRLRAAGSSTPATGSSLTVTETSTNSYPWAIAAVPVNPVPGSTTKSDQTGILLYTLDEDVKLAVAWGQDPTAATAAAPGLDVGTSVPPMPEFTAGKDGLLYDADDNPGNGYSGDHDGDGYITCGDEIVWPITVYNVSRIPVPDVIVSDEIPTDTTYVPNSTYLNGTIPIPDDAAPGRSPYPLDEGGYYYGSLPVGGSFTVTFNVTIDAYQDLTSGALAIHNDGLTHALGWDDPVEDRVFLRGRISNFVWYDTDSNGIQDPGEQGIAGVTITLQDGDGNVVYYEDGQPITTVTDSTGLYDFKGLLPGSYVVKFVAPEGATITLQSQGGDTTLDSDADPATGLTAPITIGGGEHNPTIDAGFYIEGPTQAVVSSFGAYLVNGAVTVAWKTGGETGTAGFYLERRIGPSGTWARVNDEIVPALFESSAGGSYNLIDDGARPHEALTYRLVEVECYGDVTTYGPYEVIAAQPLPLGYGANASATGQQYARTPSVARPSQVFQSATGFFTPLGTRHDPPSRLRIEVVDTGLYRIEAADIAAGVGVSETQAYALIRSRGVSLTNRGRSVAYLQAADFSGLYFYGTAIESNYTSVNVYWLTLGRGTPIVADIQTSSGGQYGPVGTRSATTTTTTRYRGSRRTTTTTSVTSSTTTSTIPVVTTRSFVERLHVEEDSFSAEGSFHDPEADFWLWDYLVGGNAALGHKEFSFECPQALSGVSLKVRLQGLTSLGIPNEHHVVVGLNGVVLGETSWGGAVAREASFSIPAGALLTGANEVELTALRDDGVWMSMVGVDSFDLAYERTTQAVGDRLSLDLSSSGPVEVTGLGSTEVWVLNVSDPFVPRIVSSSTFADDAGTVGVTFTPVRPGKHYVATVAAVLHPIAMTPATATTPGDRSLDADYLVITSPALSDAASRLADYRSSQGLKTAVLTTTEIYDEFNNGIANPQAIRQFLAQTASQRKRSPRYVVFVGEGSFDYKNRLGYGDSIVPPLLIDTEWGLASADVLFGDTQGDDGVPESAVGRIPVSTAEELDAYLDKIRAYETSDGVWRQSVVLAADDADTAGNFAVDSDELADFVPSSSTVIKAYLDRMTLAEARAHVLGGFTDGSLLVNYIGHGGVAMLAAEGLLSVYDAPALAGSGPELPILTAFTCGVGKYELPGVDGLAEALLTTEAGGAIAVYSPTTVEENSDSVLLGTLFYQSLFGSASTVVLGDALLQAQRMGADRGLQPWMLRTYNLLGDPALNVRW